MTIEQAAKLIRRYEQAVAKNNIYRYTSTVASVEEFPDIFGMNFKAILSAPPDQQTEIFLAQEQRAELLRSLLVGEAVDSAALQKSFGFTNEELLILRMEQEPIKKPIPSNLCVLCFDDALKSQFDFALPVLQRFDFDATFFITEMQPSHRGAGFGDKSVYMTWEQIKELENAGFELGNHSLHHVFGSQDMGHDFNVSEIRGLEAEFEAHGLKKPTCYAYPSGISNAEVVACVRECGYLWGRGNQEKGRDGIRGMTYYDPLQDSPLAICNFGDPDYYTEDLLRKRIVETPDNMIFGLTYHGVTPDEWIGPCPFERQMAILKEFDMKVISISGLSEYINPEKAYQYTTG